MNKQIIEDLGGSKTTLYIIMVDMCHYKFVQTHRLYNNKNELYYERSMIEKKNIQEVK